MIKHWVETYPHTIWASVLLRDNKIIDWKVGQRKWDHNMDMTRKMKLPFNMDDYADETVESKGWEVNSHEEHNKVFEVLAKEWFKQWEMCEGYSGSPAYEAGKQGDGENTKKIIVLNGKFFTGVDQNFSPRRSDALVIGDKHSLDAYTEDIFDAIKEGRIELKRIEVLDIKEG